MREVKISEAIIKLSELLRKKYNSINKTKVIISITIMAWNISLFSDEEKETVRQMLIKSLPEEISEEGSDILLNSIDNLIRDKKKLYPHVREYILTYDLSFRRGDMTLSVGSAPVGKEIRKNITLDKL